MTFSRMKADPRSKSQTNTSLLCVKFTGKSVVLMLPLKGIVTNATVVKEIDTKSYID